jgi:TRAP-type C4-dicarboxylate transport system permease small subunit
MVTAAAFLVLLDAVIVSATPNTTRIAFALVVTLVFGYAILMIWRSNSKFERAAADQEQTATGGSKPVVGGRPTNEARTRKYATPGRSWDN